MAYPPTTASVEQQVLELYGQGISARKVGQKLGIADTTARKILIKHQVRLRSRREVRLTSSQLFWGKAIKSDNPDLCWRWDGHKHKSGYGLVSWTNDDDSRTHMLAHRFSWEIHYGAKIPTGMNVCHKCDNPECCNPEHLFLGTQADNMADMCAKGRAAKGEKNGSAKLTRQEVEQIRQLRIDGLQLPEIAKQFGVSIPHVHGIVTGKRWADT